MFRTKIDQRGQVDRNLNLLLSDEGYPNCNTAERIYKRSFVSFKLAAYLYTCFGTICPRKS